MIVCDRLSFYTPSVDFSDHYGSIAAQKITMSRIKPRRTKMLKLIAFDLDGTTRALKLTSK